MCMYQLIEWKTGYNNRTAASNNLGRSFIKNRIQLFHHLFSIHRPTIAHCDDNHLSVNSRLFVVDVPKEQTILLLAMIPSQKSPTLKLPIRVPTILTSRVSCMLAGSATWIDSMREMRTMILLFRPTPCPCREAWRWVLRCCQIWFALCSLTLMRLSCVYIISLRWEGRSKNPWSLASIILARCKSRRLERICSKLSLTARRKGLVKARCKASWQGASKKVEKNLLNSQRGSCDSMCTFITIHRLSSPLDIRFCEEEGASSKQEVGAVRRYFLQLWLLPTTYSVEAQAISSSSPR